MNKNSAQNNILSFLKENYPSVYQGGELQRMVFENSDGTKASPAVISRRLRNLEEEKEIAVRYTGAKNSAEYRYLQRWERENYIPTALRTDSNAGIWKDNNLARKNKYKIDMVFNEEKGVMEQIKVLV